MSRTFTAIAGLAALIALSASAATADENPHSANSMLPACKAVLAVSSGNAGAGIDPVEMGRCIGMIEGVALLANYGVFCPPAGAIIKQQSRSSSRISKRGPNACTRIFEFLRSRRCRKPGRAKIERWRCRYPAAGVPGALGRAAPRRLCGVNGRDCPTRASMEPRGAQHDAAMIAEDISEKRARRKFAADAT
jgi:hypothetical protein